ncbi:Glyceraldehyde-3-phosphate dehydrogenase-like, C-terminal [Glarea lozoyensis ATCC 20868]|uniref:Glyceraldehyde-3-phosphate dehydrogenase-like, C-terminal n=1 Tax=Glarea lozoyensis (strain ATCC 20868 / MF5171) TaxID=1116229 RepID=S3DBV0_GLAL2|nr:Glyceraldehyde-3-phosphate dehydrogenase-like, C-terminal [Glarea lozoyensis ATCC 20868]EPE35902.1 Glyceraldehyde-3-phosphate dehydrogenase-like, C-terminal [Glarea lozoyensis ATCC 20868]
MATTKVLVLGSGMVARPCVEYLVRNAKNEVTVACRTLSTAQTLIAGLPHTKAITIDVSSTKALDPHIAAHDLVISLVPYVYHATVIKSAIKGKTNVVTTSYVSPAIKELDTAAKEAGITVLNEVGVDPGVDHLYAVKTIAEIHNKGGKVKEFYSYCGGLPAPECSDNPLGFKFSWSPRGALLSQQNSAIFLEKGAVVEIPAQELMARAKPYHVMDGYDFVAYPNRNSVPFREFYNIPEAHTVIRGSLRYEGNPAFVKALMDLGWLDTEKKSWLKDGLTWAEILQKITDAEALSENSLTSRIKEICKFTSEAESERIISGLRWMGVLSSEKATITGGNLLDTLCAQLEKLMSFQPGERDLVMLQHKFVVEWADGKEVSFNPAHCSSTDSHAHNKAVFTSTLELLGKPGGYSAMSLSVGVTCGIATQLLLDGHPALNVPGVLAPYTKEICDPIRDLLEQEGVKMVEKQVS